MTMELLEVKKNKEGLQYQIGGQECVASGM